MPFRAIPVFLHRRFRHGFVFINTAKGIKKPKDLIGKKVGVKFFLDSAALWMRGILEHEYGVPFKSIDWYTELDEDVDFEAAAQGPQAVTRAAVEIDRSACWSKASSTPCCIPTSSSRCAKRTRASAACSRTTRPRRRPISRRPAFSRSCT